MIEVLKGFHKLSSNKQYSIGDKVSLDSDNESKLVKNGFAKFVKQDKKKKVKLETK